MAGPRDFIVEHADPSITSAAAQPLLDKFLRHVEQAGGWPAGSIKGVVHGEPKDALQFIETAKPGFGMMDPDMWLALRKSHDLTVIAQAEGKRQSAGHMYLLVKAPSLKTLDELKGKKLASNHLQSPKYVSKVVFDGKVDVKTHFQLVEVSSLIKALKSVDRDEADAALISEEDLAYLKETKSPYLQTERVIFTSPALPATPLVAFGKMATVKDRETLTKVLLAMCGDAKGGPVCKDLEIEKFAVPDKTAFDQAVRRYEK